MRPSSRRITKKLKTKNAYRSVDIHSSVAPILAQFVEGKSGLLFPTGTGRPEDQSNVRNRLLYPLLERLGIEQKGFHAFRRFRVTHLRKKSVPENIIKAWVGHGKNKQDTTDIYDLSDEEVEHRKTHANRAGIRFEIPVNGLNDLNQ